jgi:anti-sigma factor RsiW
MTGRRSGPSPSEEHRVFDELAVGWALHSLEPEDEAVFAEHLPGCERCAQTVADTTEVMATMAADLPRAEPSDRLRERLSAAVAETEQIPPGERPREPARPAATGFPGYRHVEQETAPVPLRRRAPVMALAAAAVAAILGLGVWNVFLSDSRSDLEATVAQQERIVDSLLTPGEVTVEALSADDGSVVATVVARSDRVDVISHGLAPNDTEDQTYVVWGIDDTGPKAIDVFDVTGSQMTLQTVGSGSTGLDEFDQYAISLEPGREAPSEPTDIVAMG